jgi:hypothetical protein
MHDVDAAIATLQGLKALGVSLSVDDFGTGYSSLAYLENLPIDKLKIDRSFVRDIGAAAGGNEGANQGVLAQAIISLGHNLGMHVVAEGVETDAQARFLRRAGCDEVQGFFYGEAVAHAACHLLARTSRKRACRPNSQALVAVVVVAWRLLLCGANVAFGTHEARSSHRSTRRPTVAALGIVFGDIGTSRSTRSGRPSRRSTGSRSRRRTSSAACRPSSGADDRGVAEVRRAHHACRQPRRGRHHGADRARFSAGATSRTGGCR